MGNRLADHKESFIKIEGKLHKKFISILIDPGSNYSCISPELVDKCGLGKELHQ